MQFRDRITCSVREAMEATGFGKTKFHALLGSGRIKSVRIDGKRLVRVGSLLKFLGEVSAQTHKTPYKLRADKDEPKRNGANHAK